MVDTLGSVDDYGATAEFPILKPKNNSSSEKTEIQTFYESESTAVLGRETKPKKKVEKYIVEKKETKHGVKTNCLAFTPVLQMV